MNVYKRYVSGEYDKYYLQQNLCLDKGHIQIRPLVGHFDVSPNPHSKIQSTAYWLLVFPQAAFFSGFDPIFFGHVVTVVYKNTASSKISTVSVTKFGCNVYENIVLDSSSRFWPACENLSESHRSSNVRKALAISNLKNFNKLWNNRGIVEFTRPWDETNAGALASSMKLMDGYTPTELGERLLALGLLQVLNMSSVLVDLVYDNINGGEKVTAQNNALVSLLGTQMDQLFDPLLEYSPQATDYMYVPPTHADARDVLFSNALTNDVLKELLTVQTNYTMGLVDILQDFIIPLRISLLSDSAPDPSPGEVRVNQVFPPTIDEIARINCILHNSLKSAQAHGYIEVFKVLGCLLPSFYNAFVRHQANIRKFNLKYMKFLKQNNVFEDQKINKRRYTPQQVESIISGSVFELPKLKLIIMRLYQSIISHLENSGIENLELDPELTSNYKTIIETINALGFSNEPVEVPAKKRIFTPSGRLLIEIAKGWPEELQYGWTNRKVLAVYEVVSTFTKTVEILIIFTDYLLFLDIAQPIPGNERLKFADVIMNSLINRIPLPKLSYETDLRVKYWCDIDRLIVKSFDGVYGKCLSLTTYAGNSFKLKQQTQPTFSLIYDFLTELESNSTCNKIMSSITKAQILHKSTAFHLFNYSEPDLTRYYCAHDQEEYKNEKMKAPIVILLNISKKEIEDIFATNPQVGMVIALSSLNDYTMHIFGYNRQRSYEVKEVVSIENLIELLKEIIAKSMCSIFHSSTMSKELILSGEKLLELFYTSNLTKHHSMDKVDDSKSHKQKLSSEGSRDSKTEAFQAYSQYPTSMVIDDNSESVLAGLVIKSSESTDLGSGQESNLKKRRSGVFSILLKLKTRSKSSDLGAHEDEHDDNDLEDLDHPEGKQIVYKRLYKPEPSLREDTTVICDQKKLEKENPDRAQERAIEYPLPDIASKPKMIGEPTRKVSVHSALSRERSLDVATEFQFPASPEQKPTTRAPAPTVKTGAVQKDTLNYASNIEEADWQRTKLRTNRHENRNYDKETTVSEGHCIRLRTLLSPPSVKSSKTEIKAVKPTSSALSTQKFTAQTNLLPPSPPKIPQLEPSREPIRDVEEEPSAPQAEIDIERNDMRADSSKGISGSLYKKFKSYQSLPDFLLSNDSEPNWTVVNEASVTQSKPPKSLTSSSLGSDILQARIFFELQTDLKAQYVFDDSFSVEAMNKLLLGTDSFNDIKKKAMLQSPSSSVVVTEFGRQLDREFCSKISIDDFHFEEQDDYDGKTIYAEHELLKSPTFTPGLFQEMVNADRENTGYQSEEFAACGAVSSSCSDMTLFNEHRTESVEHGLYKRDEFASLMYLSAVLDGTVTV